MSQADELLNSLSDDGTPESPDIYARKSYIFIDNSTGTRYRLYVENDQLMMSAISDGGDSGGGSIVEIERHIIVDQDRFISVPHELRRIAVQYDHNIETVTFDCPRYWDGNDLSALKVYINYKRSDGEVGDYYCENVTIDESNPEVIHFDWVISQYVTTASGPLKFSICAKGTDEAGNETEHWNSEINEEMHISEGLEPKKIILQKFPDVITQIINRMDRFDECEVAVTGEEILALRNAVMAEASVREQTDASFLEAINTEVNTRRAADEALTTRVTNIENGDITKANGNFNVTGTLTANKIIGAVYM